LESEADNAAAFRSAAVEELSSKQPLYATMHQNVSDGPAIPVIATMWRGERQERAVAAVGVAVADPWRTKSYECLAIAGIPFGSH
jgi:hypothetical protein